MMLRQCESTNSVLNIKMENSVSMEKLLTLLSDGQFHSGENLGRALGVTRAAVWKKLKALEALGLRVDSARGKGYRLSAGIELLNKESIEQHLETDVRTNIALHTCLSTTSTNDLVRELAPLAPEKRHFCLAEYQTGGRGRRGRNWVNPFGSTICLSAHWKMGEGTASLEGLSLAVGLAVFKALEFCGCKGLALKWPNDILWHSEQGYKKLCGILLEVHGDPTGECEVIIGIGINVALSARQLADIEQPATDLFRISHKPVSRNKVISAVINTLSHVLDGYGKGGFGLFRNEWLCHDAYLGQRVMLDASGRTVTGIARGVDEQGGLLLETNSGMMTFNGGEVSLKNVR